MTRTPLIQRKLNRARQIAAQLTDRPFIRLLALGNSVAMGTATELSDLDFLVVTAPNRLWTARFLLLLRAKWLGVSKRPGKTADQADFGFWVDETALDLSSIALRDESDSTDDPYLSQWLATLIPLADRGGAYERLMAANREIVNRKSQAVNRPDREPVHSSQFTVHLIEALLGSFLGEPIEQLLFWSQRWKVWADPISQRTDPLVVNGRRVDVVTTRHRLKLHHVDQRANIRDRWRATPRG